MINDFSSDYEYFAHVWDGETDSSGVRASFETEFDLKICQEKVERETESGFLLNSCLDAECLLYSC